MLDAFILLFAWENLLFLFVGTALGIVVGAIPGLTASMLIALTLPLTFYMDPVSAVTLLIGEYVGGISGGPDHGDTTANARHARVDCYDL
jgi:putative tricarboxylic transport membrane protein